MTDLERMSREDLADISDDELADMSLKDHVAVVCARIELLGEDLGKETPEKAAPVLLALQAAAETMAREAVMGQRAKGVTDQRIGEILGMTEQDVQSRWPR